MRLREVYVASPRGFCAGVERAVKAVEELIDTTDGPIYVHGQIVHNAEVVKSQEQRGVIFIESIEDVPADATVVFSAHGVAPYVRQRAADRGLRVIDATCPLVTKVHNEAIHFASQGLPIILIGHAGHAETVGTYQEAPAHMHLVERVEDVNALQIEQGPVAVITQTTLGTEEVADIMQELRRRFPEQIKPPRQDICYATENRQQAVRGIAERCELVIVLGSANSSNTQRLKEQAERRGVPAYRIDRIGELDLSWIAEAEIMGLSAGASTPEHLVQEAIAFLRSLGARIVEVEGTAENVHFLPIEMIRPASQAGNC